MKLTCARLVSENFTTLAKVLRKERTLRFHLLPSRFWFNAHRWRSRSDHRDWWGGSHHRRPERSRTRKGHVFDREAGRRSARRRRGGEQGRHLRHLLHRARSRRLQHQHTVRRCGRARQSLPRHGTFPMLPLHFLTSCFLACCLCLFVSRQPPNSKVP